jgi:Ca2+-binding EF-hand superfamily protein
MSTLTGISSYSRAASYLFSKIDSSNKGYIEKEDLVSAFSTLTTGDTNAEDVFTQLDSDSDGKITESEFSTALETLAETLNRQYDQSRMSGMIPPPPPPPVSDSESGFTEEELTSQLEEIGETDPARSSLISSIVENFDEADANQDGVVSNAEAMAYAEANNITSNETADSSKTGGGPDSTLSDAQVYRQIMELMQAYSGGDSSSFLPSLASSISTSA